MSQVLSIKDNIIAEPYPGLRPFQQNESHLFFGRDEQVDKLLEKIQNSHFVAVIGPSGCGKSSLVKAGLIPALKTGCIIEAGSKWRIAEMRPGDKPFYSLAKTLSQSFTLHNTPLEYIKAELKRSPKGLAEVIKSESLYKKENFLLVVDQFEELFRYRQNNNIDEVTAFISLLIASIEQQEVSFHVIITMRSDFLGDCSLFLGLPEILNDNQFLTPRLTREQTREAIEGPALVCGGQLQPQLVNTLLNDMGVDHDQLPLLQHALMRMWNLAEEEANNNKANNIVPAEDKSLKKGYDKLTVNMDDYAKIGKLKSALSDHANQIFNKLSSKQKKITEVLFRRLSERNTEQKDIRRPATVQDIAEVAGASIADVTAAANFFRTQDNNFLTPPADVELNADTYLDISHESIMRQWDKMRLWVDDEYEDASRFKRLLADAQDAKNEKGNLLSGIELLNTLKWKHESNINSAWAFRYLQGSVEEEKEQYKASMQYIEDSRQKERKRKNVNYSLVGAFALLVVAVITLSFNYTFDKRNLRNAKAISTIKQKAYNELLQKNAKIQDQNKEINQKNKKIQSQLNSIQKKNKEIEQQKQDIESKQQELAKLNGVLQKNNALLNNQNIELNVKGFISTINQLPFYRDLDSLNKSLAEQALLPLYFNKETNDLHRLTSSLLSKSNTLQLEPAIQQFNDTVNQIIAINAKALTDPSGALRDAKKIWNKNKRPLFASLFTKMINNNLFYKQEINPFNYTSNASFALAANSMRFAICDGFTQTFTGSYRGDSLTLEQTPLYLYDSSVLAGYIVAAGFAHDTLLLANDNGMLYVQNNNGNKKIASLAGAEKYRSYLFSPDGNYVISAPVLNAYNRYNSAKDSSIKLYSIAALNNSNTLQPAIIDTVDQSKIGVKHIQFSPDSRYVSMLYNDGKLRLWDIAQNKKAFDTTKIAASSFSPAANYLVFIPIIGDAEVRDLNGKLLTTYLPIRLPLSADGVNNFTLSPDERKMAVTQNDSLIVYERKNGDPLFKKLNNDNEFISKKYATKTYFTNVSFLNNNVILTSDYSGNTKLWKTYPAYNNPDAAFSAIVIPPLSLEDTLLEDPNYYKYLLAHTNAAQLDSLAETIKSYNYGKDAGFDNLYSKSTQLSNIRKQMYQKLLQTGFPYEKMYYQNKLIALNEDLINLEKARTNVNYKAITTDLKENAAIIKDQLKTDTSLYLRQNLSSIYWNLSWYLVFTKNGAEAINAAQQALQYNEDNDGANTNLALGYLLNKEFDKAEAVYMRLKGKKYTNKEIWFTPSFLQDFEVLEKAGIITPDQQDIYNEMTKIKTMLNR